MRRTRGAELIMNRLLQRHIRDLTINTYDLFQVLCVTRLKQVFSLDHMLIYHPTASCSHHTNDNVQWKSRNSHSFLSLHHREMFKWNRIFRKWTWILEIYLKLWSITQHCWWLFNNNFALYVCLKVARMKNENIFGSEMMDERCTVQIRGKEAG